jgi:hypothetical protein
MSNGRVRIAGLGLAALLAMAALMWLQPYSVFSPYRSYTEPARRFLRAALARDLLELQRQAVSAQPVEWALEAADGDPSALAIWMRSLRPYSGRRHGDTTMVVFQTSTRVCYLRPITLAFVGGTKARRLALASSSCSTGR